MTEMHSQSENRDESQRQIDGRSAPVLDLIGETPLIPYDVEPAVTAHLKPEWQNPGASMKDRMVTGILEQADRNGDLEGVTHLIEGSSGNTGTSLSLIGNALGYDVTITVPEGTSAAKRRAIEAHGATLRLCPDVDEDHEDHYRNVAAQMAEDDPDAYLLDQYHSERNSIAHYESLGPEIWEQAGEFMTHIFAPMGTGGTLSGTAKYLKEHNPDITVVGVDGKRSNISNEFYKREKVTYDCRIEGMGKEKQKPPMWFDYIDELVDVSTEQAFETARELARTEGLLLGGSAAGVLQAIDVYEFDEPAEVVAILPDSGYKYMDTIYNDNWMEQEGYR